MTELSSWFRLWQATGDIAHLAKAHERVEASVAAVDEVYRQGVRSNLAVNREILAAWADRGLDA